MTQTQHTPTIDQDTQEDRLKALEVACKLTAAQGKREPLLEEKLHYARHESTLRTLRNEIRENLPGWQPAEWASERDRLKAINAELLEENKRLREALDYVRRMTGFSNLSDKGAEICRAAIAKAEGGGLGHEQRSKRS